MSHPHTSKDLVSTMRCCFHIETCKPPYGLQLSQVSWQKIDERTGATIEEEDITDGSETPGGSDTPGGSGDNGGSGGDNGSGDLEG